MKLPFCEMFFLSYLYPTNRFNDAKFHAQMSTKLKKQRHWFNVHGLKSFKTGLGPFRVNSQELVRAPSPVFLKFYSNCHYPIWWTSAKFEWNLSRNGMNIKLFSWGVRIIHIWPWLKPYHCQTILVNKSGVPLSPRLPMTAVKICVEKIFTYLLWYGNLPYKIHEWSSMFS